MSNSFELFMESHTFLSGYVENIKKSDLCLLRYHAKRFIDELGYTWHPMTARNVDEEANLLVELVQGVVNDWLESDVKIYSRHAEYHLDSFAIIFDDIAKNTYDDVDLDDAIPFSLRESGIAV